MEEKRDLLDLSQPETVSADRSSFLTWDNVHPRERGSQNRCISRKSTHRDTNPFMWKTLKLERKLHMPKPPKSSSTIIKWGYNLFFSREHKDTHVSRIPITRFGAQEQGIGAILPRMVVLDVYCILYFSPYVRGFPAYLHLYLYYILWPLAPR
jgi:hypothetical protein